MGLGRPEASNLRRICKVKTGSNENCPQFRNGKAVTGLGKQRPAGPVHRQEDVRLRNSDASAWSVVHM